MEKRVLVILLVSTLAASFCSANDGSGGKRSAEQLLTRVMRNDFLIRALRSHTNNLDSAEAQMMAEEIQRRLLESDLAAEDDGKCMSRGLRSPDFLMRGMRSPDFLARAMRSPNAYLVRTMRST